MDIQSEWASWKVLNNQFELSWLQEYFLLFPSTCIYFVLAVRKSGLCLLIHDFVTYGILLFLVIEVYTTIYEPSWEDFVSAKISTLPCFRNTTSMNGEWTD